METLTGAAASPGRLPRIWKWNSGMQMAPCQDPDPITIKPASRSSREGLSNKTALAEMGTRVKDVAVGVKHGRPLIQLR